jgi:hypothetical protein
MATLDPSIFRWLECRYEVKETFDAMLIRKDERSVRPWAQPDQENDPSLAYR